MPAHPPSAGRPPLSLQLRGASASRRGLRFPPFLSALDCHGHPLREGAAVVAARSRSPKPQPEAHARDLSEAQRPHLLREGAVLVAARSASEGTLSAAQPHPPAVPAEQPPCFRASPTLV